MRQPPLAIRGSLVTVNSKQNILSDVDIDIVALNSTMLLS